jgi:hypoxanthine phosphoribosyltransferase
MIKPERLVDLSEFEQKAAALASQIEKGKYDIILCVTGWGMHLSYYLSKALHIPKITNVNFQSYDTKTHIKKKSEFIDGPWEFDIDDLNVLIVDDLIDKWWTLNDIMDQYYEMHDKNKALDIAVLFTKADHGFVNKPGVNIYAVEKDLPREWIEFYYEKPFATDK